MGTICVGTNWVPYGWVPNTNYDINVYNARHLFSRYGIKAIKLESSVAYIGLWWVSLIQEKENFIDYGEE